MGHPRHVPGRLVQRDGFETGLGLLAAQERLRRRRLVVSGLNVSIGFAHGLAPGRVAPRVPKIAGQRKGAKWVGSALVAAALILILLYGFSFPSNGGEGGETRVDSDPGPTATAPPAWPPQWDLLATDVDTGVASTVVDLAEVWTAGTYWDSYAYIRIVTDSRAFLETGGLRLTSHSWWVYLDFGDGYNDWIVAEQSLGLCSHAWDGTNGDWGVGAGCDVFDTLTASDVGSAVRILRCSSELDCIDFALEKSDYPGLGFDLIVTVAADKMEDLNLAGDTFRNPRNAYGGCDPIYFDDCTPPARISLQIPEFPSLLTAVVGVPAVLAIMCRRRARRTQGCQRS